MDTRTHTDDVSSAIDFRVMPTPDSDDLTLAWKRLDGTILTVTAIRVSPAGFQKMLDVLRIDASSTLPHNALHDARGIREHIMATAIKEGRSNG